MVLQKRACYGFNGYQVPPTPRATRSARRRGVTWGKANGNQMCAFDLLACIAGKLLVEEGGSSPRDNGTLSGSKSIITSDSLACLDNNVELTLSRNHIPCESLLANRDDVKLGSRDDDENLGVNKAFQPVGDQRVTKLLASKEDLNGDVGDSFKSQRSLRDYPYKKRKIYAGCPLGSSGVVKSSYGMHSYSTNGQSTFVSDDHLSLRTGDSHVKLKIKSFRVPELFIELPETATVGSLKRTVMEAVTAIFGDGLCVGVLFHGKKVRDDKQTLLQTGISHEDTLDALGFTLEPSPSQDPQLRCSNDVSDQEGTNLINFIESDSDLAQSHRDGSSEKRAADSRMLVAVPEANLETRVTVRKPKRTEAARRRIRRPFSVNEVEALVQAVEKLGTGRWRDVKLRAFDDAKHRTYVDLKDKWKTLVHTARITPQQRRGEPVPQELLDRVLTAHAYWSQKQAKLQMKHHPETRLLF